MNTIQLQFAASLGLLKLQIDKWEQSISYQLRFILCGIFSFFLFSIYELLKAVTVDQQNSFLVAAFGEPVFFVIILYLIFFGYLGLYCAIVATSLFTSLMPTKT